ncbi:hypothetical protein DH2020_023727 [Rehmannia glutinosa]|uniref:Beta-galactosidase n=1 Tax=Rehmannia glutinosa TaxID=99300 RepID=A0ABR0W8L2_REHGL
MAVPSKILALAIFVLLVGNAYGKGKKLQPVVTYDSRSLIINGTRQLLFSGSIHYPRSTPEMWPEIIRKAKEGGLNVIQTYVFWNIHEPVQGQYHMKKYTEMVINLVKKEKLFADQGGPIIMAQIENEYNNVQLAYKEHGVNYVSWAANMAVSLYNGIPWVMCKQKDAPQTVRAAEDIAFAVARFFTRNGTLNNYYMYHGGTNFGRTSSSFVTTRYYDEAPLDEFGLKREPKFGHLRDLHRALRLSKKPLLWGTQNVQRISNDLEITTYEKPGTKICVAFLTNNNSRVDSTINFRGVDYYLPAKSVSILPDCKTVVFNTQTVVAQHSSRNFVVSEKAKISKWEMFTESIPTINDLEIKSDSPKELYSLTKDTTDYACIKFDKRDLPMRPDVLPVLQVASLGHALLAFVNGEYIGFEHGSNVEKSHVFKKPIHLKPGVNHISLLGMTVGLPNSGAFMEKRFAGPRAVSLEGLMSGNLDITGNNWGHQVGVTGEKLQLYTEEGLNKVKWAPLNGTASPVTWYKAHFDAPEGTNPVAIRMTSMAKGMIWVNGKSIGRYWEKDNLLVVFEETGGNPEKIEILTVNRDTICSVITEYHPPHVGTWERKNNQFRAIVDPIKASQLTCPDNKVITKVEFVSFGEPEGACGNFQPGKCDSPKAHKLVEQQCLGKNECTIPFERELLVDAAHDSCPDMAKTLAIQAACGLPKRSSA